jgi:hypothetical protein
VGVTRKSQIPTRWIDQGAHEAIEIAEVPNRYLAGVTEVALKDHVSDKTNWRRMLTNKLTDIDLGAWRDKLREYLPREVADYYVCNTKETRLQYPVIRFPSRVKSLNLDKTPRYQGTLAGIKGQYLIFEDGTVFNIRASEGYVIALRKL